MFAATFLSNCPRKWSQLLRYCPSTRGPTHSPNYIWLVCPRKRRNTDRKKVLRKRKWRNKSKNWTGSSSSQRMPTNCKAALKKWEETTGRKCSEATEVQVDFFNWPSLLEFSIKMIKVANYRYLSMKVLMVGSLAFFHFITERGRGFGDFLTISQ